ncbi:MAG TPA: hypothetical protein VGP25_19310 [Gemmatimonadaceae bacterium]|jgi:hypothetical protein|nr:hypothetical protein [Gemmatimonadaceae bacterium]
MRLRALLRPAIAGLALAVAAACDSATDPLAASNAAGTYVLESVTGRGPTSGTFVLRPDGTAERRARYAGAPNEELFLGSFEIDAPNIVFNLHPQPPASYVWTLHGELTGNRFSIHYPDPADGPDIVETFRR